MTSGKRRLALATAGLLAVLVALSAYGGRGATAAVVGSNATGSNVFSPGALNATAGDSVVVTITGSFHDFDSVIVPAGGTAWNTSPAGSGTLSSTTLVAGTYTFYCSIHAASTDADTIAEVDGYIASGAKMVGKIVVSPAVVDTTGPVATAVAASPNPTNGAAAVTVTASISDAGTGNSNVAAAEYSIGASAAAAGAGTAMNATDGAFNSTNEGVTKTGVAVVGGPGSTFTVWVRGRDAANNWGNAVSVIVSVTAVPAGAQTASVEVIAGNLSNTTTPVSFGSISLSGADLELATTPSPWNATDARGSGAGWNVTITATDFTSASGLIGVQNFKVALANAAIVTVSGNAKPVTGAPTAVALSSSTPLKLLSAAVATGMGSYNYGPDFTLLVPAATAPGSYSASLTVSINSGP